MTSFQDPFQDTLEAALSAPLADDELVDVRELLAGLGFEPKVLGPVLQCEQTLLGQRIGVLHLYPAQRLLKVLDPQNPTSVPRSREYALRLLWDELFGEEYTKVPRADQYLYAVASGPELTALQTSGLLYQVESNLNYARKTVCELHELPDLLRPLFVPAAHDLRAHSAPTLHLLRELRDNLAAAETVTHWLTPSGNPWSGSPLPGAQREHLGQLYGRIMGRGFGLRWDGYEVVMVNNGAGVPAGMASNGERVGFALAHFLALAYAHLSPGMTLGVQAMLPGLDVMKQLAVLDLLRHLVAVTGVAVVLQTANTSTLRYAQAKFKHIAAAEIS